MGMMTAEGLFRSSMDDPEGVPGSLQNLHYVLEMLSAISLDQASPDVAADIFEKAFQLIPSGEGEARTDPLLIAPLSKLTDKKLRLVGARLVVIAELLLSLKLSEDIAVLSNTYEAFRIVSTYKASPLYLQLSPRSIPSGQPAAHTLTLTARNIFGEPVAYDSVQVTSIKNMGKDTLLFEGAQFALQQQAGQSMGVAQLDMSSEELLPGRFVAQLTVTVTARPKPVTFQSYFAVVDAVDVVNVRAGVLDAEQQGANLDESALTELPQQNTLPADLEASSASMDSVRVEYALTLAGGNGDRKPKKPHQSFARLTHKESGHSVYAVGKRLPDADGENQLAYSAEFYLSDDVERFQFQSGVYTLSLLIADSALEAPIEWVAGSLNLLLPAKPQQAILPLYAKSLLHTSDNTLSALPEIVHQMRPPARRASSIVSTIFTVATWLPLLVFVSFVLSLQPNLNLLRSVYSLGFVASLALMLALYVGYWLALEGVSFYQTIRYICFLFPLTIFIGRYSLMSVANIRAAKAADKAKQQ